MALKRLNVGCGKYRLDGYIGVDAVERAGADIVAKADSIPLPTGSCQEIMAIHLWEHFYLWEAEDVLREWSRLLVSRGRLVLELPDLVKCCENVLSGRMRGGKDPDQLGMWGLYGDPRTKDPFMMHRWAWSPKTLRAFLEARGYGDITEEIPQWHPAGRDHRDMRLVAIKA
jgi:hypothetical protein